MASNNVWSVLDFLRSPEMMCDALRVLELIPPNTPHREQVTKGFMDAKWETTFPDFEWNRFMVSGRHPNSYPLLSSQSRLSCPLRFPMSLCLYSSFRATKCVLACSLLVWEGTPNETRTWSIPHNCPFLTRCTCCKRACVQNLFEDAAQESITLRLRTMYFQHAFATNLTRTGQGPVVPYLVIKPPVRKCQKTGVRHIPYSLDDTKQRKQRVFRI